MFFRIAGRSTDLRAGILGTILLACATAPTRGDVLASLRIQDAAIRQVHAELLAWDASALTQIASTAPSREIAEAQRSVHETRMAPARAALIVAYSALATSAACATDPTRDPTPCTRAAIEAVTLVIVTIRGVIQ